MSRKGFAVLLLCLLISISASAQGFKKAAIATLLERQTAKNYSVTPHFASAEICTVRHDVDGDLWGVDHWLIGDELYKSYQNPGLSCDGPYPFSVEYIYMVLFFEGATDFLVSVDVEDADLTDPTCPLPGDLLSISTTYTVTIPSAGLYQIEVPLDSSAVVEGPYFAGFYFADYIDTLSGATIVTDDVPVPCVSYNIWDTTLGFVDLTNTGFASFPSFPGRLLLYSAGTPGGSGGEEPEPAVTILTPASNEIIVDDIVIWAAETAGSGIIDYMQFEYKESGDWIEIGYDYDGIKAIRDGLNPSGTGDGYSLVWDYSGLSEGVYWLRTTVYDTLGRSDADSIQVNIDPTPPMVTLVNPAETDTICHPLVLEAVSPDEDVSVVKFEKLHAAMDYNLPVITLNQSGHGDDYCGPVCGAIAVKYWFDQGFILSMREGNQYLSADTVVERMADAMLTGQNDGTPDDLFYSGFLQYVATHGNELLLRPYRNPDYTSMRAIIQDKQLLAVMALSGTPGLYLVAAGVSGLDDVQGQYTLRVSDPLTGSIVTTAIRNDGAGGAEVLYNGNWLHLDMIITVKGYSQTVTRDYIGADISSGDGWKLTWNSSNMAEDSLYFITITATDASGRVGSATSMSLYNCSSGYAKGDYNGDGTVNIGDILYLIDYIYEDGPEPLDGGGRADANCDGSIDIGDVIYFIKHVLAAGPEPCY
nr:dockerin type I repeat-containing protein [candidate division Zixibacteria bacterium]